MSEKSRALLLLWVSGSGLAAVTLIVLGGFRFGPGPDLSNPVSSSFNPCGLDSSSVSRSAQGPFTLEMFVLYKINLLILVCLVVPLFISRGDGEPIEG